MSQFFPALQSKACGPTSEGMEIDMEKETLTQHISCLVACAFQIIDNTDDGMDRSSAIQYVVQRKGSINFLPLME